MKSIKAMLNDYYKDKYNYVEVPGWMDKQKRLRDIYTVCRVIRKDKSGRVLDYDVTRSTGATKEAFGTRTTIFGEAGAGKSTFLTKMCLDWAHESECILDEFSLVFMIPLNDIEKKVKDVLDLIRQSGVLPEDELTDEKWDCLKTYIRYHPQKACFLLDGFDELDEIACKSLLHIWQGNVCRKVQIVMSSRIEYRKTLERDVSDDCSLELIGFNTENKMSLIKVYFSDMNDNVMGDGMVARANIMLSSPLSHNPLFLTLM